MSTEATLTSKDDHRAHAQITVLVNERKVHLTDAVQTGRTIKLAAIQQGVPIQPDFILSIELGGGRTELVPDDRKIRIHEGQRFLAIRNDDNS